VVLAVIGSKPAGIVADDRSAEKAVLEASAPRLPVEYTPDGNTGLELALGVKVLVETQNAVAVASVSPFMPFSVASLEVMPVAGSVITSGGAAKADGDSAAMPALPASNARAVATEKTLTYNFFIMY